MFLYDEHKNSDQKAMVLLWLWSTSVSSQAIMTNDLVIHLPLFRCTKWNTMVGNQLVSQPIVIVLKID